MKKLALLFLLIGSFSFAQIQSYPNLILNNNWSDVSASSADLVNYTKVLLSKKNYNVYADIVSDWSEEVQLNPCSALRVMATALNSHQIKLSFADCNQKIIAEITGTDNTNDSNAYASQTLAIQSAVAQIAEQTANIPDYREQESRIVNIVKTTTNTNEMTDLFRGDSASKVTQEEIVQMGQNQQVLYQNESGLQLQRTNLSAGQILLSIPGKNEIYARLYPSSQAGVYQVKLIVPNGKSEDALGFVTPNSIKIESNLVLGTSKIEVFQQL